MNLLQQETVTQQKIYLEIFCLLIVQFSMAVWPELHYIFSIMQNKKKQQKFIYAVRNRPLQPGKFGKIEPTQLIGSLSQNFAIAIANELESHIQQGWIVEQQKNKFGQFLYFLQVKSTIRIVPENVLVSFPISCTQQHSGFELTEQEMRKFILEFKTIMSHDESDDSDYSHYSSSMQQVNSFDHKFRGRPKGSKNRRKESIEKSSQEEFVDESNKKTQEKRGRGRPKGAKNIKKQQTSLLDGNLNQLNIYQLFVNLFETKSIQEVNTKINRLKDRDQRLLTVKKQEFQGEQLIKRSRGRPKGVKNKPKLHNQESESEQTQQIQSLPKRKPPKGLVFGKCCSKCMRKQLKKQFFDGKNVSIEDLSDLTEYFSAQNHQNIIIYALKSGDLDLFEQVASRRDTRINCFAISWDGPSRLEDCYYTVRTKKEYIAKGKREGIHALIQDCHRSFETIWWKSIGLQRILQAIPGGQVGIDMYELLVKIQPDLRRQIYLNITTLARCGNEALAGYLFQKVLESEQNNTNYGYSNLHLQSLNKRKNEIQFKKTAMLKQCYTSNFCSPIHCAAINPNTELLSFILKHISEFNVGDSMGRKPIHYAAVLESSKQLELLVRAGADLKDMDKRKCTPLMLAAKFGRLKNLKFILQKVRDSNYINFKGDQGLAAIHYAVIQKHTECVLLMIEDQLVEKQLESKEGMNIFHFAAANGQKEILKILIEHGYTPEPDNYRRTPLMIALRNYQNQAFFYLFSNSQRYYKRDYSYNTLLHYAAAYGNLEMVKYLQEIGIVQSMNRKSFYPFEIAVLKGHYQCAKLLQNWTLHLSHHLPNRLAKNPRGTAQFFEMFEYLLQTRKYDLNYRNPAACGFTCLHFICALGQHEYFSIRRNEASDIMPDQYSKMQQKLISLLLKYGADSNVENDRGEKALQLCIQNENLVGIQLLLRQIPFDLYHPTRNNSYIYYLTNIACIGEREMEFVYKKLLETDQKLLKAEIRRVDSNGFQFLIYLVKKFTQCAHENFRQKLAQHRKSIALKGENLSSAELEKTATLAAFKDYLCHEQFLIKTVNYLVQMGADPKFMVSEPRMDEQYQNYKKWGIQHFLMRFPSPNLLKIFMKWIDTNFNLQNSEGRNPLHLFCMWNSQGTIFNHFAQSSDFVKQYPQMQTFKGIHCLQYLLENGLTSNVLDINRSTPLLYAALRGQLGFLKLLRNFGSTINNINSLNQVPFIELIRNKNSFNVNQIEAVLIDQGLKADFKDNNERNALHHLVSVAKNFDNSPEICCKLLEYGVNINSLDKYDRSPIFYCFIKIEENQSSNEDSNDKVEILQTLLGRPQIDLKIVDVYQRTPLHYACQKKFFFSILYLLQKWENEGLVDSEGNTPLAICFKHRNLNQAAMLIKRGVGYGCVVEQGKIYSYIQYAFQKLSVGICFMLIDHGYPKQKAIEEAEPIKSILIKKYGK